MKQKYEKSILTITRFSDEDVITTSEDRNNAYRTLEQLNQKEARNPVPTR